MLSLWNCLKEVRGVDFHSYGSSAIQLGIDQGEEEQMWKKSSGNSRPQQLEEKASIKCRAAPTFAPF